MQESPRPASPPKVELARYGWRGAANDAPDPLVQATLAAHEDEMRAEALRFRACRASCSNCRSEAHCEYHATCDSPCASSSNLARTLARLVWTDAGGDRCARTLEPVECVGAHRAVDALFWPHVVRVDDYDMRLSLSDLPHADPAALLERVRDRINQATLEKFRAWANDVDAQLEKNALTCALVCRNIRAHKVGCGSPASVFSDTYCTQSATVRFKNRGSSERVCWAALGGPSPTVSIQAGASEPVTRSIEFLGERGKGDARALRAFCVDPRPAGELLGLPPEAIDAFAGPRYRPPYLRTTPAAAQRVGIAIRQGARKTLELEGAALFRVSGEAPPDELGWIGSY